MKNRHAARSRGGTRSPAFALSVAMMGALVSSTTASAQDAASAQDTLVVEAIEVLGNKKTEAQVIRDKLVVSVGDLLDELRVEESRLRLLNTGFFRTVECRLRRGSQRGRVLLVIEVAERNTILIDELRLGTSPVAPIFGGIALRESNFLGHGVGLAGSAAAGSDRRGATLRVVVPDISNTPLEMSSSFVAIRGAELLDAAEPEGQALRYQRIGGTLGIGFRVGAAQRIALSYRLESVNADRLPNLEPRLLRRAPQIQFDDSVLSTMSLTYERDARDDPFVPTSGGRVALGIEVGTALLGSSYEYSKYIGEAQVALEPFARHSVVFHAFAGMIQGHPPFFDQFFPNDTTYFVFGRDSLPRSSQLNFSPSNDYDDLIACARGEWHVPVVAADAALYRAYVYVGMGATASASLDELQEDASGRGSGGALPLSFDAGVKLDTYIGNFVLSLAYALNVAL